jgi:hypothetical protein
MSKQEDGGRHHQPSGEQDDSRLNEEYVPKKISSILDLSRYKVGDIVWWVTLRYKNPPSELPKDDTWMLQCHPKTLFERGIYKSVWPFRAKLPRLHQSDFTHLTTILSSEFTVEQFEIFDVVRSKNTGEFFYSNNDDEWMPEASLFDTSIAARREHTRIVKMVKRWTESQVGS